MALDLCGRRLAPRINVKFGVLRAALCPLTAPALARCRILVRWCRILVARCRILEPFAFVYATGASARTLLRLRPDQHLRRAFRPAVHPLSLPPSLLPRQPPASQSHPGIKAGRRRQRRAGSSGCRRRSGAFAGAVALGGSRRPAAGGRQEQLTARTSSVGSVREERAHPAHPFELRSPAHPFALRRGTDSP